MHLIVNHRKPQDKNIRERGKNMGRKWKAVLALCVAGAVLAVMGCGRETKAPAASSSEKRTVNIAYVTYYVPYDFQDADGQPDGMEVAVMKKVAKMHPDWDVNFIPTSDEELLIGVEAGKYDAGIKGVWKTPAREKKFIFPKHPSAASVVGLVFRSEDADRIHSLEDFAQSQGKLVPISPQSAQYTVIQEFNKQYPDTPIKLDAAETFQSNDAYTWVLEKRYDAYFDLELLYRENVVKDTGPYHQFADKLSFVRYKAIPTYPLFNRKDQDLANAYDAAMDTMVQDGTFKELQEKYFGEEITDLVK